MPPAPEPVRLERLPRFAWAVIAIVALAVLYTVFRWRSCGRISGLLARARLSPAIRRLTCRSSSSARMSSETSSAAPEIARVAPGSPADAEPESSPVTGCAARASAPDGDPNAVTLRRAALDRRRTRGGVARALPRGRERTCRLGSRRARRCGSQAHARPAVGPWLGHRRVGATSPRDDRPDVGVHRRGSPAPADAQLRPHRGTVRAGARVQRRRRRRTAARAEERVCRSASGADGLRVDREPAGVSDHRARDPLLPHPLDAARSASLASRRAAPRRGAARRPGADDGTLSGRRGVRARPRGLGRHASGRLLRRVRRRARHQRPRGRRGCLSATGSTTTPTSGAASAWRSTRRCRASSPTPSRTAFRSSPAASTPTSPRYPGAVSVLLDALVLLPAFGLVYAVGVAHVLGPRVVLRRSLQYALANRSLTLADLPAGDRARVLAGAGAQPDARRDRDQQLRPLRRPHHRLGGDVHEPRCARGSGSISASSARSTTRARSCSRSPAACASRPTRPTSRRWSSIRSTRRCIRR